MFISNVSIAHLKITIVDLSAARTVTNEISIWIQMKMINYDDSCTSSYEQIVTPGQRNRLIHSIA